MSLPLLHAGRTNPGLSAALDLRFALDKSLTAYRGPTPSFSRASTGSYFDGSGVLRYAAVNILNYSEDFTNAYWLKVRQVITANAIASPNGDLSAEKLAASNGATVSATVYRTTLAVSSSTSYTVSIYAKKAEWDFLAIGTDGAIGFGGATTWFNLNTGAVGTVNHASAAIQSVGNGWYRCSISGTTSTTNLQIFFNNAQTNNSIVVAGDGTSGIYIWGAQVEASPSPTQYAKVEASTSAGPRFNHTYNGTSWVSKGLLVEEQRTNQLTNSNTFTSSFPSGGAQLTSSATTSPDGTTNASKIYESASGGGFLDQRRYNAVAFSGSQSSFSIYAKAAERRRILLFVNGPDKGSWFDLISETCGNDSTYTGASQTIQNVGNGWYRCTITVPASGGIVNLQVQILLDGGTTAASNRIGDGVSGFYIAFAQHEIGAFSTSYIGTTSSAATRSADVCQITGGDFSGFWNGTEGTLVAEYDRLASVDANFSSGYPRIATAVKTSDTSRAVTLFASQSPAGEAFFVQDGTVQAWFSAGSLASANAPTKLSAAYKANDFAASLNGASVATDTSGTIPSGIDRMDIGNEYGVTRFHNGHIARLRYYPKRLPNATLQLLSDPDPTLNLQFALNKSLTPVAGPAPSFSRASTATFFNASGILTSASINTPRFDHVYSGGQWVSKGLLLEEQRTNYVKYANDLSTNWTNESGATREYNSVVSPDGGTNATKVNVAVADFSGIYQNPTLNSGSGTYTYSIFAKKGTKNWLWILNASGGGGTGTFFNIANGTLGNVYSGYSASIIDCGNSWYRCILTTSTTTPSWFQLGFSDSNNSIRPDSTGYSYVYGAQIELGSFATSFISNNTSSSVTRSADVCQITGTSFNWMWNQGEGSALIEFDLIGRNESSGSYGMAWQADDNTLNNRLVQIAYEYSGTPSNAAGIYVATGGTGQANMYGTAIGVNTLGRSAFAWKTNDFALSVNGGAVATDTSGSIPLTNQINFGRRISDGYLNGHISKLIYYPARLLDAKLQKLST